MSDLALTNVITVSVSAAQQGIGEYNVNNLALFTHDTPGSSFGVAGYALYLSPTQVATDFGTSSVTYQLANQVFSQQPNILAGGGYLAIIPFGSAETLAAAITRTEGLVQYFGIITDHTVDVIGSAPALAAAAVVQPLNKMLALASYQTADLGSAGALFAVQANGYTQTRGLYYGGSTALLALSYAASYMGTALSTNFNGNNTTQTMHLKSLVGVTADPTMTQSILATAQAAGADCYVSLQGVAKVFTSGVNQFFDQVFNLQWFVGALQVAGFNYLAQASTKIPQTEAGMSGLKSAYRAVCQQAVTNQYLAPGAWNSSTTFGNQADLLTNVADYGYYIYSQPVSQQSQAARTARQAPLVQLCAKQAGAIQSSTLVIYVNA